MNHRAEPSAYQARTFETHEVENQPPSLPDLDLLAGDAVLRTGAGDLGLADLARAVGTGDVREHARLADENRPVLRQFDRYGHRIDRVEFHPSYHALMRLGIGGGVAAAACEETAPHTLHAARLYLMTQADAGVCCPMSMSYAAVAALRGEPRLAREWVPRIAAARYDPAFRPAREKSGATIGMAMTEKQGGSDVRANTTTARPIGADGYELVGHKWFCSAPMSDAFLTLARLDEGLTCFLVPRLLPDGTLNAMRLMRLKDKLGDRSNASCEIEYHGAWARPVGEPGRGVATIIAMVQGTRLSCIAGSAGGMRAALTEALWHARHRSVFQRRLIDQPAMTNVLADLALEAEAATALMLRVARAFDDAGEAAFARIATPLAKYHVCKRQPGFVVEALEAHGGAGYVEEGPMPRLFRQSPLNAIWEGSGNVIALDVLRAIARDADAWDRLDGELRGARGAHDRFDASLDAWREWREPGRLSERAARRFARDTALLLQARALLDAAPATFEAFCAARLDGAGEGYGTVELDAAAASRLIERAMPVAA